MYGNQYPVPDPVFYERLGPYLDEAWIAHQQPMYFDGAHLNRAGALRTSDWVASRIAPMLAKQVVASAN
jgi:hypothetical protein